MYVCISGMRRSIYRWMRTYLLFTTWDYHYPPAISGNPTQPWKIHTNPHISQKDAHIMEIFHHFPWAFWLQAQKKLSPLPQLALTLFLLATWMAMTSGRQDVVPQMSWVKRPHLRGKFQYLKAWFMGCFGFICIFKYRLVSIFLGGIQEFWRIQVVVIGVIFRLQTFSKEYLQCCQDWAHWWILRM